MQASVRATVHSRDEMAQQLHALGVPGLRIAPSSANFLWLDLGRPNAAVHEALLARGIITKAWKDPGFESCLRVSIGMPEQNAAFAGALGAILDAR